MNSISLGDIKINDLDLIAHMQANLNFLHEISVKQILRTFYLEAGLWEGFGDTEADLGGCEAPVSAIRGQFAGHYLSACAKAAVYFQDKILRAKAEVIVDELIRCQKENGGQWLAAIPAKSFDFLAQGKNFRVPGYVVHKIVMGLFDVYKYLHYAPALSALCKMLDYLYEWTGRLSEEQMLFVRNEETGGLTEIIAEAYGATHDRKYLTLLDRFVRRELFDLLLNGVDALTNMHANTTVPEAVGVARAYEITGDQYYYRATLAYYDWAVKKRGYFVTGGNNSSECFIPPMRQAGRMNARTQEHCTSYNLVRLADFLYRWTGEAEYADYMERCIYNSLLPQNSAVSGTVSYFLPITGGGRRNFCSKFKDFPCCLGTSAQSNASYAERFLYADESGLNVAMYYEAEGSIRCFGDRIGVRIKRENREKNMVSVISYCENESIRPAQDIYSLQLESENSFEFDVRFRIPYWANRFALTDGEGREISYRTERGHAVVRVKGTKVCLYVTLGKQIRTEKMADADLYAFMWGAKVLAGVNVGERILQGNPSDPRSITREYCENEWGRWKNGFYTVGQSENFELQPLCDLPEDCSFTIYFPIVNNK